MNWTEILVGIVGGGLGIKVIERLLPSSDTKAADAATVRKELWDRLTVLETHVGKLQTDLDEWQQKYYTLHSEHAVLKNQYEYINRKYTELKAEMEKFRNSKES